MIFTAAQRETQNKLKAALQNDADAGKVEELAAALLGRLLGITVAVAKSGFQHGADAGPAGRQGRRLRVECKKYADTTSLSDRELLGEIDHALARDPALEAWILVATREVSEQLEQSLNQKGESIGVPIVVLDFKSSGASSLAALCSCAPDLVEQLFSREASELAKTLQPELTEVVERLKSELVTWRLGFDALRDRSLAVLGTIWNDPRASAAALGQNAAGGSDKKSIQRRSINHRLDEWWSVSAKDDAPAALVGWDGVGKTWAGLDWLVSRSASLPIALIIPSSAVPALTISETGVKRLLADRLYELAGVRDRDHWLRRLDNLLKRPLHEGPVLTILFDGLNQESSVSWLSLLKLLQAPPFAGRVRVIVSTRRLHFETKLSKLRGLVVPAVLVPVDAYDVDPGGELDQMLSLYGLERSELQRDLIELARTPRLIRLIVRFHDRLVDANQVTVHRLLWEYGRDSFGERAGRSFSEIEWHEWLREIATRYRVGVREFSLRSLADTTARPDLSEHDIYARLSEIVDGQFATPGPSGVLQLRPDIVAHALGAALLNVLESTTGGSFESFDVQLNQWLDPIGGFDQRAEILRAAVSILVERGATPSTMGGALVTAWLQTQNVADAHRLELSVLAPHIPDALLDAVEHSHPRTHASARSWAIHALRSIDRIEGTALNTIVARLRQWSSIVPRDLSLRHNNADLDKRLSDRLIARVGIDAPGPIAVLGVTLHLIDEDDGALAATAATILDGFPLQSTGPLFETVAIATAVARRNDSWDGLKWLVLLNEKDPAPTTTMLRDLAARIRTRAPEPGVHHGLPGRVAALLLWMTGAAQDDVAASEVDPGLDRVLDYSRDYLAHPSDSLFALERRHAADALSDTSLRLLFRIKRARELWFDPTFRPPQSLVDEIRTAATGIDVEKLDGHSGLTAEDHAFDEIEAALARCAPDLLSMLARKKVQGYPSRKPEERYWVAIHATSHFVLIGPEESAAARELRQRTREASATNELITASQLLILELKNQGAIDQAITIIDANVEEFLTDVASIVGSLSGTEADALIDRYSAAPPLQRRNLLLVVANHAVDFSASAWQWLTDVAQGEDAQLRGIAHRALALADAGRFGRELQARDWTWSAAANHWENDFGTEALIEGAIQVPFEQIAPRLAPWRLLEAARRRGGDPAEVRLACTILGRILGAIGLADPDPGATLSVDRSRDHGGFFSYSVSPIESDTESTGPGERLRRAFDTENQLRAYQRAADVAFERVQSARAGGADLYLVDIPAGDMEMAMVHCPDLVALWLEGFEELTSDFVRRVHLAEGAFLSICEAMLKSDPPRGASLFRAVRQCLNTRFTGAAGVDELLHIAFRAPDSPDVRSLLNELASLEHCHSDQALMNLALAATVNRKDEWLRELIAGDEASALEWRRRRSTVLRGFMAHNELPVDQAWPAGEIATVHGSMRHKSAQHRYIEACARHWWKAFLSTHDEVEAYAAWVLFLGSADRRAWAWIDESEDTGEAVPNRMSKDHHFLLNRSRLQRAIEKRENKLDRQFLNRDIVEGCGPWV